MSDDEHIHDAELVPLDSPDMLERKLASLGNPPRPTIDANLIKPNVTDARTGRTEVRVRLSSDGQNLAKQIAHHYRTNWLTVVYVLLHRELTEVEEQLAMAKGRMIHPDDGHPEPLTDDERLALHQAKQALAPG